MFHPKSTRFRLQLETRAALLGPLRVPRRSRSGRSCSLYIYLCSPEVKRCALQRELSSFVQTDLTGQITLYMRLQSAARARSVDGTVARGKMADAKSEKSV